MGAHLAVERRPLQLAELLAYAPTDPAPPSAFRSNLKVWRFFAVGGRAHEVQNEAVGVESLGKFRSNESYVVLHIYRRRDPHARDPAAKPTAANGKADGRAGGLAGSGVSPVTLAELATASQETMTPRGLAASFSGYNDCGPYPFEGNDMGEPLAHDIYVWNGTDAVALIKAVALTKCFELERFLLNDAAGTTRHLHAGAGSELVPLDAWVRQDDAATAAAIAGCGDGGPAARNHLLAQLLTHRDEEAIDCGVPVATMIPAITGAPKPTHFTHAAGAAAGTKNGAAPPPPAGVPKIGLGGLLTTPAAPAEAERSVPKIGLGGLRALPQPIDASPPSAASVGPERSVPKIGLGALRPGSGGDAAEVERSVPKIGLGGLKQLSPDQTQEAGAQTPRGGAETEPSLPRLGVRGGMPGTAAQGGGAGGGGERSSGSSGVSENGSPRHSFNVHKVERLRAEGAIEEDEHEHRVAKLRRFDGICSQIEERLYLGSNTVAQDLPLLLSHGVTHVLNTAGVACADYHAGSSSLKYKTLHLYDTPREDISTLIYEAIEFIDAAIVGGGVVFVHCHQGVSRSSSMVIAYLMWRHKLSFNDAFQRCKAGRGITSPNAGFIAALLGLQERVGDQAKPPDPPRLYRMAPFFLSPRARLVEAPLSYRELDPRTVFVLHTPDRLYIWVGGRAHDAYLPAAQKWAELLQRFEMAPRSLAVESMGSESSGFWVALGGKGDPPPKLPQYDSDYGVGKTPLLTPPKIELPPSLRVSGDRRDVPLRQPSGMGLSSANSPRNSMGSPRSTSSPPVSARSSQSEPSPPPHARPLLGVTALDRPPPGTAPSQALGSGPPPATPRGKTGTREKSGAASPAASKKPRDAAPSELYLAAREPGGDVSEWEPLGMFDSDDLDGEGVLILLTPGRIYLWIGAEAEAEGGGEWSEAAAMAVVKDFAAQHGAGSRVQLLSPAPSLPVSILRQGEEGDDFWAKENWPNG